jgi:hypothetical protein
LRRQFRLIHGLLDASIDELGGPTAACYAQSVLCEDLTVNGVLAARAPLALSTWRGRTGLSELPALATPIDWAAWAVRVRLDLADFRSYARAVYAATDAYLAQEHTELTACLLNALLLTVCMRRGETGIQKRAHGANSTRGLLVDGFGGIAWRIFQPGLSDS